MSIKSLVTHFFTARTSTGTSEAFKPFGTKKTFQASGATTAGAGAATVIIEATNDESLPYVTLGTIALTLGTTAVADGFASDAAWLFVRARITAISGTNASLDINMGSIGHS